MTAAIQRPPRIHRLGTRTERWLRRYLRSRNYWITPLDPSEWTYLESPYDDKVPLPPGAAEELRSDNLRLTDLRQAYAGLKLPVSAHSVWSASTVDAWIALSHFRGDSPYMWHYRERPHTTALKYFVYLKFLLERDSRGLFKNLDEDGAFGCWTFSYPGHRPVSRDLLDSVNELYFLGRHTNLFERGPVSVLDIGAGYGRLAHRAAAALPSLREYCCVDAVPESTFLCEYYLRHRDRTPPAHVVPLYEVQTALKPNQFDLAVNIHSFSECTFEAVAWWSEQLRRLQVPELLIVPNDGTQLLTTERDRTKKDFRPLLEAAGYRLAVCEPVIADPAVRELLRIDDHFFLFRRIAAGT